MKIVRKLKIIQAYPKIVQRNYKKKSSLIKPSTNFSDRETCRTEDVDC